MDNKGKHKNYEILNLIGYGLAKFDISFIECLGFKKKTDFYKYLVEKGIAETIGTIKNRQDLFDPFFSNGRKGWWQKGDTYIHRKIFIDSLFGSLNSSAYANIVQLYLQDYFLISETLTTDISISPVFKSKFKQLSSNRKKSRIFFYE